jgi:hypothetical protein
MIPGINEPNKRYLFDAFLSTSMAASATPSAVSQRYNTQQCFGWTQLHPLFSCSSICTVCLIITETLGAALCRILTFKRLQ